MELFYYYRYISLYIYTFDYTAKNCNVICNINTYLPCTYCLLQFDDQIQIRNIKKSRSGTVFVGVMSLKEIRNFSKTINYCLMFYSWHYKCKIIIALTYISAITN